MILKDSLQTGRIDLSASDPNWNLADGEGDRAQWTRVYFERPFRRAPQIMLTLVGLDAANDRNLRITLEHHSVTPYAFDLEARTWSDSSLHYVSVMWTAFDLIG